MIRIKKGVNISGIQSEMVLGINIAEKIFNKHNVDLVITSCTDGSHSRGSLHYVGFAIDARSRDITDDNEKINVQAELQDALGNQFDIVIESTHYHIEFQPKHNI